MFKKRTEWQAQDSNPRKQHNVEERMMPPLLMASYHDNLNLAITLRPGQNANSVHSVSFRHNQERKRHAEVTHLCSNAGVVDDACCTRFLDVFCDQYAGDYIRGCLPTASSQLACLIHSFCSLAQCSPEPLTGEVHGIVLLCEVVFSSTFTYSMHDAWYGIDKRQCSRSVPITHKPQLSTCESFQCLTLHTCMHAFRTAVETVQRQTNRDVELCREGPVQ